MPRLIPHASRRLTSLFLLLTVLSGQQLLMAQGRSADGNGDAPPATMLDVWIGTGRSSQSRGIYHCQLNLANGRLTQPELAGEAEGPGFLAMHPNRQHLYAVCGIDGKPCVADFQIERTGNSPSLRLINAVETGDGGATHVCLDRTSATLLTAQYGGGSVAAFHLSESGQLQRHTQLIKHAGGSAAVAGRQDAPHAHWVGVSPDNRFAFVPDLGLDKVLIYQLNAADSLLTAHGAAVAPAGSGPRHMKFHPNGRWMLVLNELSLTISVFRYDADRGTASLLHTIPTVPEADKVKEQAISASEIRIHPSGRFVYSANRGHDTITVFKFDADSGALELVEREHIRGATPRNFNLDPTGHWLLAAGQDSNTLGVFAVDQETGELTWNRSVVNVPNPICVLFGPDPQF
ncbi:MAG: lactonase family protein [Planctomycetaceae bacterium]|nr:lactonase family protein [Planctomycetaceae bacterium]